MIRSKKTAVLTVGFFLFILISGVLYLYNRADQIKSASNQQQLLSVDNQEAPQANNEPVVPDIYPEAPIPESTDNNIIAQENTETGPKDNPETQSSTPKSEPSPLPKSTVPAEKSAFDNKVASKIEQKVGTSIDTSDLLQAGFILMGKLSNDEIAFLFDMSNRDYTNEELKEVRELLLQKLTPQDIEALKAIAEKYGKNLDILDPNIPIE